MNLALALSLLSICACKPDDISSAVAGVPAESRTLAGQRVAAVAAASEFTCALDVHGRAYCWGANYYGQLGRGTFTRFEADPVRVAGGLTFTAVAAGGRPWGESSACAVEASGQVYCWGNNWYGQLGDGSFNTRATPSPIQSPLVETQIANGEVHACALNASGQAYCWGSNGTGELGNGAPSGANPVPGAVTGGLTFTQLSLGASHSCGLTAQGKAYCWGGNTGGELGTGDHVRMYTPTPVAGSTPFVSITAGRYYTCGVAVGGTAYCWGKNSVGQLGTGDTTTYLVPTLVRTSARFTALVARSLHTCGITSTGALWCWGFNFEGELGRGTATRLPRLTPGPAQTPLGFTALASGDSHTCGSVAAGAIACWGFNASGQLGIGQLPSSPSPVYGASPTRFRSASTAVFRSCGLDANGYAWCWGNNGQGALGIASGPSFSAIPTRVSGTLRFRQLAIDGYHGCGLTPAGKAYCWGANYLGQLGDGTFTDRMQPVAVVGGLTFTTLAAGYSFTCGTTASGQAYCWGANTKGTLGVPFLLYSPTPVAVQQPSGVLLTSIDGGEEHTCGATSSGEAYCWGENGSGQLGDGTVSDSPIPVRVVTPVALGGLSLGTFHTCARTPTGQGYCWGDNYLGELGTGGPPGLSLTPAAVTGGHVFSAISAGEVATCGLDDQGKAYCWGEDIFGQLGLGTYQGGNVFIPSPVVGAATYVNISAGFHHACALLATGQTSCWGSNQYGELNDGTVGFAMVPAFVPGSTALAR